MIAFDTNVLVRLLVRDDPEQFAAATALLEAAGESGEICYLADAVLCEVEWVLTSRYSAHRADVLAALTEIAADGRYAFDAADTLAEALRAYAEGRADFSDYLIGAIPSQGRPHHLHLRRQAEEPGGVHLPPLIRCRGAPPHPPTRPLDSPTPATG